MQRIDIAAILFPQFHSIPENDKWWGYGFTDWVKVKEGTPKYNAHHQPRVPLNERYYDMSKSETIRWQVDLARKYGIDAFNIYHYWFDGKLLLEKPAQIILENKDLNIKFFFNWANESWARRWEGHDSQILMDQQHEPTYEKWKEHFDYVLRFFKDDRYYKIDNKPVFIIYRPHLIKKLNNYIGCWNDLAIENGFNGMYFIAVKAYEYPSMDLIKQFDGVMNFQPFEKINSAQIQGRMSTVQKIIRRLPEPLIDKVRETVKKMSKDGRKYDYDKICSLVIENDDNIKGKDIYDSLCLEWDNTARYGNRSMVIDGCTPKSFLYWLDKLFQKEIKLSKEHSIIFINAWNEWAEGTYLEPDEKNGFRYLEAVKKCAEKYNHRNDDAR